MSQRRLALGAVTALALAASGSPARADSPSDLLGPREIAVGESRRAEAVGAMATRLNPAGLSINRQLVFEASYGYRPSDSASVVHASACDSTVPVPGCFYYNYFKAKPTLGGDDFSRRGHEFGMASSRALTQQLLIGLNVRYFDYNSDLTGEEDASGFGADLGVIFRANQNISVAVVGHNLYAASDPEQYPLQIGSGLSLRPGEGALGISADAVWSLETEEGEGTGRYGGGLEYFLTSADGQAGYPLRAGAIYDAAIEGTYLTGGIGFASTKFGIDVSARKQVGGGDELIVLGGIRLFGPSAVQ